MNVKLDCIVASGVDRDSFAAQHGDRGEISGGGGINDDSIDRYGNGGGDGDQRKNVALIRAPRGQRKRRPPPVRAGRGLLSERRARAATT